MFESRILDKNTILVSGIFPIDEQSETSRYTKLYNTSIR